MSVAEALAAANDLQRELDLLKHALRHLILVDLENAEIRETVANLGSVVAQCAETLDEACQVVNYEVLE